MLKSWLLQNFKPILDSGELKLAPVTVLAGRNSSGKSSLIQSILMIAQTLSSRVLDRALLPNGPIVQLGTFEDILSEQTNLRTLVVGFELEIAQENTKVLPRTRITAGKITTGSDVNIKSVKVISQFRSPNDDGASDSAIEASRVNIENVTLEVIASSSHTRNYSPNNSPIVRETKSSLEFGIDIRQLTPEEANEFFKEVSPESLRLVPYSIKDSNYLGTFKVKKDLQHVLYNIRTTDSFLIAFSHFLPTRFVTKYTIEERRKSRLMSAILISLLDIESNVTTFTRSSDLFKPERPVSQSLREAILNLCKDENILENFSGQTISDLIAWYRSQVTNKKERDNTHIEFSEIIAKSILEDSLQTEASSSKKTEALETVTNNDTYVENLGRGVEQIIQFFTSKIRYLGPLRADPQSAQRFSPSSELDDVGAKGEYAAAVYDANQNANIRWYNPFNKNAEQGTLKKALNIWVSYLGVANEIKIQTAGQSGVSWQVVHMKGRKALPLTAVGVGVSQVLPILVMGLLAPSNTLLLVEQPELHLHPSVQARLGDFFMGLATCEKQCLIETHSENLVNQLRFHIVQAGEQENSDCLIYFVDQDEQGAAKFNPIKISAKGNILNWPDGFFDETMLQEDRITAAGLKKRADKTHNA